MFFIWYENFEKDYKWSQKNCKLSQSNINKELKDIKATQNQNFITVSKSLKQNTKDIILFIKASQQFNNILKHFERLVFW